MELKPQKVNVSENWKDWVNEAFQISKNTFLTNIVFVLVISLSFAYLSMQLEEYFSYVLRRFSMILLIPIFTYYLYAINIKYDNNRGILSPDFRKKNFTDVIMFHSIVFIIIALLGGISPEHVKEMEITPSIQYYFNSFLSIGLGVGSILACAEIIMTFLGFGVLKSINYFWGGIKKNIALFIQLFFLCNLLYILLGATYYSPFVYLIIFAVYPFQVSLVYVVFKHVYTGTPPEKKRKEVKIGKEAYN